MKKNNKYKICTIMTTGRTGSDYLAGCLDGVKNIMVFSGKFNHQIFFKNHKQKIKKEILIYQIILGMMTQEKCLKMIIVT